MKVTVIISGLGLGGAELMLLRLLPRLQSDALSCRVISLTDGGRVVERLREAGITVDCLVMRERPLDALFRLFRLLRSEQPDIVFTWLYHADLIGSVVAKLAGCRNLVWNVRNTVIPFGAARWSIYVLARICALFSHVLPIRIVFCSLTAAKAHAAIGYASERFVVIPNGFDPDLLQADPGARSDLCRLISVVDDGQLIGRVGRYDAQKDYPTFFEAAALIVKSVPSARFVLIGTEITQENADLMRLIEQHGLRKHVHLLGERQDIYPLMAGLDLMISSSLAEAFPNVIAEAMALGVPVVATDVGDSGYILGECGALVPAGDSAALARQSIRLLALDESQRVAESGAARQRIRQYFSLDSVVDRYQMLFQEVLASGRGG